MGEVLMFQDALSNDKMKRIKNEEAILAEGRPLTQSKI